MVRPSWLWLFSTIILETWNSTSKKYGKNLGLIFSVKFPFLRLNTEQIKKPQQGMVFWKENLVSIGDSKTLIKSKF